MKRIIRSSDDLLTRQMDEIIAVLETRYEKLRQGINLEVRAAPEGLDRMELPSLRGLAESTTSTREVEPVPVEPPGR